MRQQDINLSLSEMRKDQPILGGQYFLSTERGMIPMGSLNGVINELNEEQ